MAIFHRLECTPSAGGFLFECVDGCGRRLVVDRIRGELTVIDRGDQLALHRGGTGDIVLEPPTISPA